MRMKNISGDERARAQENVKRVTSEKEDVRRVPGFMCKPCAYSSSGFHVQMYTRLVLAELIEFVLGSYALLLSLHKDK
jgi:hypothetical protein